MKQTHSYIKCLALLAALMLLPLRPAMAQEAPDLLPPVSVQADTFAARVEPLTKLSLYNAAVIPHTEALSFAREGVISQIHVVIGQDVKAGDALITLIHEEEEQQLRALQEEMRFMEENACYQDELFAIDMAILETELRALQAQPLPDEKQIALKQLDMEELRLNNAMAADLRAMKMAKLEKKAALLQEKLSQHTLFAPFDGRIAHMADIVNGAYVTSGAPLVFLADDTRLSVRCAFIPGSELSTAHDMYALIGAQRYAIAPVSLDPQQYVAPASSGDNPSTDFVILAPDDHLSSGQYAAVCVASHHLEAALVVPSNALYQEGLSRYLYVDEGGTRVRREVETGLSNDVMVEITHGLKEGEIVYVKE